MKVLPFLFPAVKREFENLPKEQQNGLIQAGQFAQIIKDHLHDGYDAIIHAAATQLGITDQEANHILTELAKKLGVDTGTPEKLIDKLQSIVNKGLENSVWDNLWHSISGQLAIILSGGELDWGHVALGLIQFVYTEFVSKQD